MTALDTRGWTVLDIGRLLARHRFAVVIFPLLVAVVTAVISLALPPSFTATTTFVPESPQTTRLPAGLAGLATQFGISLGSEASKSPRFYAEVLRSRELRERLLNTRFQVSDHAPDSATLLVMLGVSGRDRADSVYRGLRRLNRRVAVRVNNQTNIVTLDVDARDPVLAASMANKLVEYLNAFNTQYRQSQAREQRRFVEQRVSAGERDLQTAEESLRTFYERNRSWQHSPQLTFEEGRLRRQVDLRQEVYLTLKREHETARIQEVNDTPIITVIDAATPPVRRSKPRRRVLVLTTLVLAGMVGVFVAATMEYVGQLRRAPSPAA
jgi:uncharacterized protein involved in exopolysaccharide biosynthesis